MMGRAPGSRGSREGKAHASDRSPHEGAGRPCDEGGCRWRCRGGTGITLRWEIGISSPLVVALIEYRVRTVAVLYTACVPSLRSLRFWCGPTWAQAHGVDPQVPVLSPVRSWTAAQPRALSPINTSSDRHVSRVSALVTRSATRLQLHKETKSLHGSIPYSYSRAPSYGPQSWLRERLRDEVCATSSKCRRAAS